jgi:hypothetical protein
MEYSGHSNAAKYALEVAAAAYQLFLPSTHRYAAMYARENKTLILLCPVFITGHNI